MRLTIPVPDLAGALAHVTSVVHRDQKRPILSNVLLEAADGVLRLTGSDDAIQIREEALARIDEPGVLTVDAQRLYDAVRSFPAGGHVAMAYSSDDPRLRVSCLRSVFRLPVLPATDFPIFPEDGYAYHFGIASEHLARLLSKTAFAAATTDARPYLCGVFLHSIRSGDEVAIRAVATNGHRLALAETEAPEHLQAGVSALLPSKTVAEVRKLLDDAGEITEVSIGETKAAFNFGRAVITSRLLDGRFIEYETFIKGGQPGALQIDRGLITQGLKRALIVAERARSVQLHVSTDQLRLASHGENADHLAEEIDASFDADDVELRMDGGYVLDALARCDGEMVRIGITSPRDLVLITDPADAGAKFVIVPQYR